MANWVEKAGGLPHYIKRIEKHLREKGMTESYAIATAVNAVKEMCATGDTNFPGRQEVNMGSRAEACAAVEEWEAKKAKARTDLTSRKDKLLDSEFLSLMGLSWPDDVEVIDLSEKANTGDVLQLPLDQSKGQQLGRKLWRKAIMPIGKQIQYEGGTLDFTADFAEEVVRNFNEGAFESVPLVLADKENKHNEFPENKRGEIIGLETGEDALFALVETDPRGTEMLSNDPKMGISPRLFTNYVRGNDGREFGTVLRHGAVTLDPQVYGLGTWESVDLSADHGESVIDLSASEYISTGGESMTKETEVKETPAAGAADPAAEAAASGDEGKRTEQVDLTAVNGKLTEAIDLANRAMAEKNELADKLHATEVEARLEKLQTGEQAVPKALIDLARPLVMRRETQVIDLTAADGTESKTDVASEVFKMLEAMKVVPMTEDGKIDLTATPATDADAALEALREQFGTS